MLDRHLLAPRSPLTSRQTAAQQVYGLTSIAVWADVRAPWRFNICAATTATFELAPHTLIRKRCGPYTTRRYSNQGMRMEVFELPAMSHDGLYLLSDKSHRRVAASTAMRAALVLHSRNQIRRVRLHRWYARGHGSSSTGCFVHASSLSVSSCALQ